ncbi:aldehyde dehydrogenase family protein [Dictyocaulus viviparus]|uniref:Aldehyde dehydrogenase family protein n=1 Tax=Dictyocaulus viviparus TaxID=29172 RepID=A0A0D8XKM5_DICVI|nr:aldehyde dehydrogenase family protein [Dictyocaulus viviparus]
MNFSIPSDLSGGLYFLDGKRSTIESSTTFDVFEPRVEVCLLFDDVHYLLCYSLQANLEQIAYWEVKTNGKPIYEARMDIESSADTLEYFGGVSAAVLQGDQIDLPGGSSTRFVYTRREPYGVVAGIGAWNYPFQTCIWKVGPALAAGNAIIYKPSPFAPASAVLIGEIMTAAGLPNGLYNVVQGEAATGNYLCVHPLIRKVSFTGSVAGGMAVQRQSALENVKPVTLELGGKSALIIFDDSDVKSAVATAMMANFLNQGLESSVLYNLPCHYGTNLSTTGQVCTNATRVFVQKGIFDVFTSALLKECDEKLIIGDPLHETTRVGANINEPHLNKILQYIESAKQEGGKILRGGKRVHPHGVENGFYFEPAIIVGLKEMLRLSLRDFSEVRKSRSDSQTNSAAFPVQDDARAVREEIFGACCILLSFDTEEEVVNRDDARAVREEIFGACCILLSFDTEEEVVNRVNNTMYGLAAGIFSSLRNFSEVRKSRSDSQTNSAAFPVQDDARAVREEIFGACCILLSFDTEEEVVNRVNNTMYGLAAGIFSSNLSRCHRLATKLQAGTVYINTYNDTEVNVPFGGYKNSGYGRENCIDTLRAFTQTKSIYVNIEETTEHCF